MDETFKLLAFINLYGENNSQPYCLIVENIMKTIVRVSLTLLNDHYLRVVVNVIDKVLRGLKISQVDAIFCS